MENELQEKLESYNDFFDQEELNNKEKDEEENKR
jgi:hypothetical protein